MCKGGKRLAVYKRELVRHQSREARQNVQGEDLVLFLSTSINFIHLMKSPLSVSVQTVPPEMHWAH